MIVESGVPLELVLVTLLLASLGCRVFLEIPDPKAQLAILERKEKRGTVKMEPQASLVSLEVQDSEDLQEMLAPKVNGVRRGSERMERRVNVDLQAQLDPRDCLEWPDVLEPKVLKAHQDLPASEERRGSLVAPGSLPLWGLMVREPRERRENQEPLDSEDPLESKGNGAHLD